MTDPSGYEEALTAPRFHSPIELLLSSITDPTGRETASPVLFIDGREHSIEQALDLADEIRRQVELYRFERVESGTR